MRPGTARSPSSPLVALLGLLALVLSATAACSSSTHSAVGSSAASGEGKEWIELIPADHATAAQLDKIVTVARARLERVGYGDATVRRDGQRVRITFGSRTVGLSTIVQLQQVLTVSGQLELRPIVRLPDALTGAAPASGPTGGEGGGEVLAGIGSTKANPCRQPGGPVAPLGGAILPDPAHEQCYVVGSGQGTISLTDATAKQLSGRWVVLLMPAASSRSAMNQMLNACFERSTTCPTGEAALLVDEVVVAAPLVQAQDLASNPNGLQISGNFTELDAKGLAAVLGAGPLPVKVTSVGY